MNSIKIINGKFYLCTHNVQLGDYVYGDKQEYLITVEFTDDEIPLIIAPPNIKQVGSLQHANQHESFKIIHEIGKVYYKDEEYSISFYDPSSGEDIEIVNAEGLKQWVSYYQLKFEK